MVVGTDAWNGKGRVHNRETRPAVVIVRCKCTPPMVQLLTLQLNVTVRAGYLYRSAHNSGSVKERDAFQCGAANESTPSAREKRRVEGRREKRRVEGRREKRREKEGEERRSNKVKRNRTEIKKSGNSVCPFRLSQKLLR